MHERYDKLMAKLKAAREVSDFKAIRRINRQIEKWQAEYGAYAPVR